MHRTQAAMRYNAAKKEDAMADPTLPAGAVLTLLITPVAGNCREAPLVLHPAEGGPDCTVSAYSETILALAGHQRWPDGYYQIIDCAPAELGVWRYTLRYLGAQSMI
jgi:hypothetical protein